MSQDNKLEAMELVSEQSVSAARHLNVHANVLRKWIREAEGDPRSAFPNHRNLLLKQLEIAQLRRELTRMKAECRTLHKAAA